MRINEMLWCWCPARCQSLFLNSHPAACGLSFTLLPGLVGQPCASWSYSGKPYLLAHLLEHSLAADPTEGSSPTSRAQAPRPWMSPLPGRARPASVPLGISECVSWLKHRPLSYRVRVVARVAVAIWGRSEHLVGSQRLWRCPRLRLPARGERPGTGQAAFPV